MLHRLALLSHAAGIADFAGTVLPSVFRPAFSAEIRETRDQVPDELRLPSDIWNSRGLRPANRVLPRLAWFAEFVPRLADPDWWSELRSRIQPRRYGLHAYDPLIAQFRVPESILGFQPGVDRCREICVNVVAPFVCVIAEKTGNIQFSRAATVLYHDLAPAPHNTVTRRLGRMLGLRDSLTSLQQQGLLELDANYCRAFRCRECLIGKASMVSR